MAMMLEPSIRRRVTSARVGALLMLLATLASSGCASQSKKWQFADWDVRKAVGWNKDEEKPEPQVPVRLVATWTETVLNKAGEKPTRGFGGRIAFFNRDSEDSVRVDGQLVVYAFDETSRPSHETHPTRKYIFPADEVVRHESESKLGPAYSFWLPWDEVGGPQRNISLIARFEPKGGPIVVGEQTKHFLPGSSLDPRQAPQLAVGERSQVVNSVRLATYSAQAQAAVPDLAEAPDAATKGAKTAAPMSTATIPLPLRLGASVRRPDTTTFDARATAALPLSQLASRAAAPSATTAAALAAPAAASELTPSSPAASPQATEPAGMAAPGSLRDSLLGTLPAQVRQSAPRAPGRAR
jgi:hypothetical protein